MRSTLNSFGVAVLFALFVLGAHQLFSPVLQSSASEEQDREAILYHGVTACGVERWHVKTGIDPAARNVNTASVAGTTIVHLRSLKAPSHLPKNSRIKPTEL